MSALDRARARLADAESVVARWQAEHAAKTAERDDLAARVGDLALDDPAGAARLGESLARLTAEIDVAARAVVAAAARAKPFRPQLQRAEAAALREQAGRKRAEGRKGQQRMAEDLKELRERYGVEFGVKGVLSALGTGAPWFPPTNWQAQLAEADRLERQAAELEQRGEAVEREFAAVR